MLANIGCRHHYLAHFDLEHHRDDKPQCPPANCSDRERRLYDRNLAKWETEILQKYTRYKSMLKQQEEIMQSTMYQDFIDTSMLNFPHLKEITLSNVGRCAHMLSDRFMQTFYPTTIDCAMPMEGDTANSKSQLASLLLPQGKVLPTVQRLSAHLVSPRFFASFLPKDQVLNAFTNLRTIDLAFRLERTDAIDIEGRPRLAYSPLVDTGTLRDALAAAAQLEDLTINFDDMGYYGSVVSVEDVLGGTSWPKLKHLNLDCMTTTAKSLMATLEHQPSLRYVTLGFFVLDVGFWTEITDDMKKDLKLRSFRAHGVIEDPDHMYSMQHVDVDSYIEDCYQTTLEEALNDYVCDTSLELEDSLNPLDHNEWADLDDLRRDLGIEGTDDEPDWMDVD